MRMNKRAVMLLAAVPTIVLMIAPPFIGSASADTGPTFSGSSSSAGFDAVLSNDSLPLGIDPELEGPATQSSLDSLGDSDAQAAFPDLGSTVDGVPGLAGALFGGLPVPAYPLVVSSNISTQHATSDAPGIALTAESQAGTAEGTAVVGTEGTGFTSTAEVAVQPDQSVVAQAQTTFGVDLLNLVSISGVQSQASVTADSQTGELTRTSSMSIGQISIPGLNVSLPPGTPTYIPIPDPIPGLPQVPPLTLPSIPIPLGGTTLPLPDLGFEDGNFTVTLPVLGNAIKFALPAGPVLSALKALGIDVTYETAQKTATGVIAPALTFSFTAPALPQNNLFNGTTGVSFTLGASQASVTLHPVIDTGSGSDGGGSVVSTGSSGSSASTGTATTTSSGTTSSGSGSSSGGLLPGSGSGLGLTTPTIGSSTATGGTTTPPATGTQQQSVAPQVREVALVDRSQADLSGLYLIAVAVAGVALAAASILRLLGVRLLWGS
jgi:hypothetical protein